VHLNVCDCHKGSYTTESMAHLILNYYKREHISQVMVVTERGQDDSVIFAEEAFGHPGFGGAFGFADPAARMSFGYTMNRMGPGLGLNERGQGLVDATYLSLGYTSNAYGAWIKEY
jgi:CubicO group peptidase (beta-lactamase class C family)